MNSRPSISPYSWIGMTCGSRSRAASSDSRRNRAWNSADVAMCCGRRFSATTRFFVVS